MASAAGNSGPRDSDGREQSAPVSLTQFFSMHRVSCLLFLLRLSTIVNGVLFFIPLFSVPQTSYRRCILSYAAVSAFRLSQRLSGQPVSRAWFTQAAAEDSGHYLFYCLVFYWQPPIGVALAPLVLFSILHAVTFSKTIFRATGTQPSAMMQRLTTWVEQKQRDLLQAAANVEVLLMPLTVILVFMGGAALFLPFVYYRFLKWRYTSQRNPYCRLAFTNFRFIGEHLARHPSCPAFVRNAIYTIIQKVSMMHPADAH